MNIGLTGILDIRIGIKQNKDSPLLTPTTLIRTVSAIATPQSLVAL
jgi:hypothetical protein